MCRLIGICVILSYFFWQLPKIPSKVPNSFLTDFFRFIFSMFLNWNAWDSTVAVQRQMTTHGNPLYMYLRRCSVTLCFTQRTSSFKGNVVFLLELSNPYAQYISSSIWTSTAAALLHSSWICCEEIPTIKWTLLSDLLQLWCAWFQWWWSQIIFQVILKW